MNPLRALNDHGQVVWMDFIRRDMLTGGELERLVREDGVTGVTSNPAIFEKAIGGSAEYDEQFAALLATGEPTCTRSTSAGVRRHPSGGRYLAPGLRVDRGRGRLRQPGGLATPGLDTEDTVTQARDLWRRVDRPNLMIKVPATDEGIPAIESCWPTASTSTSPDVLARRLRGGGAGLSARVADARRAASGSVASFFVSRVDSKIDSLLRRTASRGRWRCAARSPSPTRSSPTGVIRRSSRASLSRRWRARRPAAAGAVGEHQHQEPELPGCALRRRADRPADGQHRAAEDDRCVSRPRSGRVLADRGGGRGGEQLDALAAWASTSTP